MAISTNPKPTIYRNLYENTGSDLYVSHETAYFIINSPPVTHVFPYIFFRWDLNWYCNSYFNVDEDEQISQNKVMSKIEAKKILFVMPWLRA